MVKTLVLDTGVKYAKGRQHLVDPLLQRVVPVALDDLVGAIVHTEPQVVVVSTPFEDHILVDIDRHLGFRALELLHHLGRDLV